MTKTRGCFENILDLTDKDCSFERFEQSMNMYWFSLLSSTFPMISRHFLKIVPDEGYTNDQRKLKQRNQFHLSTIKMVHQSQVTHGLVQTLAK